MRITLPSNDLDLVLSLTPKFWSRFNGARLFITGGTGFVGRWMLEKLPRANDTLGRKIELVVLTRDPERARRTAPHIFISADTTVAQPASVIRDRRFRKCPYYAGLELHHG